MRLIVKATINMDVELDIDPDNCENDDGDCYFPNGEITEVALEKFVNEQGTLVFEQDEDCVDVLFDATVDAKIESVEEAPDSEGVLDDEDDAADPVEGVDE